MGQELQGQVLEEERDVLLVFLLRFYHQTSVSETMILYMLKEKLKCANDKPQGNMLLPEPFLGSPYNLPPSVILGL